MESQLNLNFAEEMGWGITTKKYSETTKHRVSPQKFIFPDTTLR
jgi:hypothetical protein